MDNTNTKTPYLIRNEIFLFKELKSTPTSRWFCKKVKCLT